MPEEPLFSLAGTPDVVMGGRCQKDYQHSVPKQKHPATARLSLNFSTDVLIWCFSMIAKDFAPLLLGIRSFAIMKPLQSRCSRALV